MRRTSTPFPVLPLALVGAALGLLALAPRRAHEARVAAAVAAVHRVASSYGPHGTAVAVRCEPADDGLGGYLVWLLTAKHVGVLGLDDCGDLTAVEIVATDPDPCADAALLRARCDHPVPVVRLREAPMRMAEDVWVVGYGGDMGLWVSRGCSSGENSATAPVWYGDSGGAVLDADGYLLGLVAALEVSDGPWGGVAVPHHVLVEPATGWLAQALR